MLDVSVTFTATVTPTGKIAPTGTVTFDDSGATIGSANLATVSGSQVASFATSSLTLGSHSITAIYSGDKNNAASTSAVLDQIISGGGPVGVVSPTSLNFGRIPIGQTSTQQRVSLTNTGDSELTVSSIVISGDFALPVNHCANGVKPGTHCDVYVTFTPHSPEVETGTLMFVDNASNSPQTVVLAGIGTETTSTVLSSSVNPSRYGQVVALTAVVFATMGPTQSDR
jgi:Bacterial Ig-like domain (group 3)/Abnormal spindle-like microcephaly-assoc'd, ASPM-SPD-2-Hydin